MKNKMENKSEKDQKTEIFLENKSLNIIGKCSNMK